MTEAVLEIRLLEARGQAQLFIQPVHVKLQRLIAVAEDVHFGDDTSELETFDSSIWDSLFELTTDDPFGAGTPPPTGPVETVTPAEPVESTAPALTTTITLLQGGLL